jgi:hypothetical protein
MAFSQSKLYKPALLALAAALLVASSQTQRSLNRLRGQLGLTRVEPLENAPPILALTTVVLGGFRGLIANALWIRAMELQEEDKYFEKVQLADWITKLQPHNATVWIVQAWDMSYNISIKFTDPRDRWHWVLRGIELLRDQAIRFNPHDVSIYRELGWHFQHKMGHNLDDAHLFFKGIWATEMQELLKGGHPNWDELLHPATDDAKQRVRTLVEHYKLDPARMQAVDTIYGPLDWRMPETHAIYWAYCGRLEAQTKDDLIQLRRVVYQSMQLAFERGRLIEAKIGEGFRFEPNLDIIPKTNAAYEEAIADDAMYRDNISRAHKNFLLNATYFLYTHNRTRDANRWLDVVKKKYPNDYPENLTLDEYALRRIGEDVGETDMNRTTSNIMGSLRQSFLNLIDGDTDAFNGYQALARNIWARYQSKVVNSPSSKRVGLRPLKEMQTSVLEYFFDPNQGLRPEAAAILRSQLDPSLLPPPPTNAPPSTNAPSAPKSPP